MNIYISAIIYGLSAAGIFFMVSLAISIGYGLMRIVNIEALLYYSIGAYVCYTITSLTSNFFLGALAAMVSGGLLGFVVETLLIRKIYKRESMFTMVATFSVLMMGIGIIQWIWGLDAKPVTTPINKVIEIGLMNVPIYRIVIIGIAIISYIGIELFLNKTIAGKALRAGIENRNDVEGLGININKIFTRTFIIASCFAGLAGALNSPLIMVTPYMGYDMLLFSFITVILGGLGSIKGTMVASLIIGQVINLGGLISGNIAFIGPFVIMFIIIILKPNGLFGVKSKSLGYDD